jgi:hypothetical protein
MDRCGASADNRAGVMPSSSPSSSRRSKGALGGPKSQPAARYCGALAPPGRPCPALETGAGVPFDPDQEERAVYAIEDTSLMLSTPRGSLQVGIRFARGLTMLGPSLKFSEAFILPVARIISKDSA